MKLLVTSLSLLVLASVATLRLSGLCPLGQCSTASAQALAPGGRFLESRASDDSGAAVLAWDFEHGRVDGRDLSGLAAVAEVSCEGSLDDPTAARRSIIYLDRSLGIENEDLLLGLLRANCAELLGEVAAVKYGRLSVDLARSSHAVAVDDRIVLEGGAAGADDSAGEAPVRPSVLAFAFDEAPLTTAEVEAGLPACCSPNSAGSSGEHRP